MTSFNCSCVFAKILDYYFQYHNTSELFDLEGNSLAITIDELPSPLAIHIKQGKIEAFDQDVDCADVQISGNLKAIINMIREENGLEADELYIQGKLSKAKQFHQLLSNIHLDWQQLLTRFISKEQAKQLSKKISELDGVLKTQLNKGGDCLDTKLFDIIKYSNDLSNKQIFDEFTEQLSSLSLRVDKLYQMTSDMVSQLKPTKQ